MECSVCVKTLIFLWENRSFAMFGDLTIIQNSANSVVEMRARVSDVTWSAFGSILAPFWEPKWAPEAIGNVFLRRHFQTCILKPILEPSGNEICNPGEMRWVPGVDIIYH